MPKASYAYDMFGGSGTVAANMASTKKFKHIHYVELDYNVERIVTALAQTPAKKTIQLVKRDAKKFKLSSTNRDGYLAYRDFVNAKDDPLRYWILVRHAHSNLLRFSRKSGFNVGFGNRSIIDRLGPVEEELRAFQTAMERVTIHGNTYGHVLKGLSRRNIEKGFFYFDPPYLASGAHAYVSWTADDDRKLMSNLDILDSLGAKWMMSNVFRHRHFVNKPLKKWAKRYHVQTVDMTYMFSNAQADNHSTEEVIITNYKI